MKNNLLVLTISALFIIFSIVNFAYAQDDKANKIDDVLNYYYENDMFNGAVLIAENGKVLYKNAFGYSNLNTKEELTLNTSICIGSVSKQFTAMAIMILKDQNKLCYNNLLSVYFPDVPFADQITIRHLLNHTSGIPRWMNNKSFRVPDRPGDFIDDITNDDVYNYLVQIDTLDFIPGERYSYSNSGYLMLAMIVEKVSGQPFYKFLEQYIFNPLNMKNTMVWNITKPKDPHKATGYDQYGEIDDYNILTAGAGSIYSTVEDLYKWDRSLYTDKLVSHETLNEAYTPGFLNSGEPIIISNDSTIGYGFGWLTKKNDSEYIVWHDGGFNGFSAMLYRELYNNNCIIILSNKGQTGLNSPIYFVHDTVLKILNGEAYRLPHIPISLKLKNVIDSNGIDMAIEEYHKLRELNTKQYDFSETQLNSLGYHYLYKNEYCKAKHVFKLNTEMYPKSANTYDSFGEACMFNGDYELAIENYQKSLLLNPDKNNAQIMIAKIKDKIGK